MFVCVRRSDHIATRRQGHGHEPGRPGAAGHTGVIRTNLMPHTSVHLVVGKAVFGSLWEEGRAPLPLFCGALPPIALEVVALGGHSAPRRLHSGTSQHDVCVCASARSHARVCVCVCARAPLSPAASSTLMSEGTCRGAHVSPRSQAPIRWYRPQHQAAGGPTDGAQPGRAGDGGQGCAQPGTAALMLATTTRRAARTTCAGGPWPGQLERRACALTRRIPTRARQPIGAAMTRAPADTRRHLLVPHRARRPMIPQLAHT